MKHCITILLFLSCIQLQAQKRSLDFYITQAKQNSPLLTGYRNQIVANRLDSLLLLASLKPQVNFISNNNYAPVINGWGYDEAVTNGANISALVQAQKNFITPGYLAAQHRSISLQSRALLDTIKLSEQDLIRTIAEQYITAYGDMLTMDYSKDIYDLLKKEEEALKKLTQSSVYKQTDYLAFYVTMQQQELTYLQAQIQYNADYLTLNYLAGIVDTTTGRLEEPVLSDSLPHDLYGSVFYQRYMTDSLRIANEHLLIDYSYKPKIGIYADAGYMSSLAYTPYKNVGFSVGLNVTVPIYDGRQKALKHRKLDMEERTRLANKNFFLNQYQQQTAMLYRQLNATNTIVEKIKQQIDYTNTLIKADIKLLETGDIKLTDLIMAVNNYFNAQNLLRQNSVNKLRIINQINYWNR